MDAQEELERLQTRIEKHAKRCKSLQTRLAALWNELAACEALTERTRVQLMQAQDAQDEARDAWRKAWTEAGKPL